jgi:YD repeat-containing protein
MTLQQRPVRNATTIGVAVCSHSGEFAFTVTDLHLPGRGIDLELSRSYRSSLTERRGVLGRGWTANFAESVERDGDDLVLHDASGADYRFVRAVDGTYVSPPGLYRVLVDEKKSVVVRQRLGRTSVFEAADRGGRLREVLDRNRNAIRFSYAPEQTSVVDTLNRKTIVTLKDGLAQEIIDEAGRSWRYRYDDHDRMVEVIQPSTESYPKGTVIRYGYDDNHRLTSITDAKGQTYLANTFDDAGRVVAQKHGNGSFEVSYETLDVIDGGFNRCRTTCRRKNGSSLVLEHNELGNEITRTLMVGAVSLAAEDQAGLAGDVVPLVTTSAYNRNSELVAQTLPAGNTTEWLYSDDDPDPRNHGNLVQVTQSPAPGAGAAPASIVTAYAYDSTTRRLLSKTDPRGSVTTHRYDDRGNRVGTAFAPAQSLTPTLAALLSKFGKTDTRLTISHAGVGKAPLQGAFERGLSKSRETTRGWDHGGLTFDGSAAPLAAVVRDKGGLHFSDLHKAERGGRPPRPVRGTVIKTPLAKALPVLLERELGIADLTASSILGALGSPTAPRVLRVVVADSAQRETGYSIVVAP